MSPDYSIVDISPSEWRRFLGPVGAVWVVALAVALITRGIDAAALAPARVGWPVVIVAGLVAALAWPTVGLVAVSLARAIERLWLARWPRLGAPLTRRRHDRWWALTRSTAEASGAGQHALALRRARRRNAIAIAEPQCPHWTADRWASAEARVWGAYGLDVASAWPRLWLTMPAPVQAELRLAFAQWHRVCVWASWTVLYSGLALLWWPLAVPAVALAWSTWARGRAATEHRAALVEAAFDAYGARLAAALGVALVPPGQLNPLAGERISARISKGA